ncbi:ubiquitin carboxyl-terminal hydrolase MINDY-1 [Hemicordylus capensis]|uniref:ubiquitin carboxyl-terminal hydrolase MINDY-1 n=1 Tax=Hemicordylus capensis TaxID=884348 RepID=UPI0023021D85|nr:ubiquitin carboxyl-terminal hydrolase MINDY-1 [Hemicordylus capensis]XP_053134481.1 ubiquitin carboxyl-terminal hydrolase MINDY-1 [Hemicordylus capensis]
MEPTEPLEAKWQGEDETTRPEMVKAPPEQGKGDSEARPEMEMENVPAVNGQEANPVPGGKEPPSENGEENALKEDEAGQAEHPAAPKPEEAESQEREQTPGEEVPLEDAASPPSTSSSSIAVTDPSSSCRTPEQAAEAAEAAPKAPSARPVPPDFYCVKWISWKGERTPVITQSENGPCPLLAIMNILFLQWKVKLPPQKEVITSDELMAHLGDCILSIKPQSQSEALQLNFQQNVNDAMTVLPKLSTGLDVNVRFTGVADFEYTPECIVFDLLNIPLYHGWLVDPQISEMAQAVGKLSYNQLVEKIITCKHSSDPNLVTEGLIAEQFLESTASQLSYHGLCELTATVKEGELSVFFRNNHFSTMIKHKSHLYLLVTDQGFLQEEQVAWESLHSVDGDSCFCDAEFHLSHALGKEAAAASDTPQEQHLNQRQVDQDYMIALSLQQQQGGPALSDLELAQQLQQEEYQQQQPPPAAASPAQGRGQPSPRPAGERRPRQKQDSDCVLL